MNWVKGTQFTSEAQMDAMCQFVHRFTGDNFPDWAEEPRPDGSAYPLQFADDLDWLAHTEFAARKDGELDKRASFCQSTPTWPNNPELRT